MRASTLQPAHPRRLLNGIFDPLFIVWLSGHTHVEREGLSSGVCVIHPWCVLLGQVEVMKTRMWKFSTPNFHIHVFMDLPYFSDREAHFNFLKNRQSDFIYGCRLFSWSSFIQVSLYLLSGIQSRVGILVFVRPERELLPASVSKSHEKCHPASLICSQTKLQLSVSTRYLVCGRNLA